MVDFTDSETNFASETYQRSSIPKDDHSPPKDEGPCNFELPIAKKSENPEEVISFPNVSDLPAPKGDSEAHPTEIAFDIHTAHLALKAF